MTTTTYTITHDGDVEGRGWTLARCAIRRLTHDGARYEIVEADGATEIHVSQRSENSCAGAGELVIAYDGPAPHGRQLSEWRGSREQQLEKLYERICYADWPDSYDISTDADYDVMLAQLDD